MIDKIKLSNCLRMPALLAAFFVVAIVAAPVAADVAADRVGRTGSGGYVLPTAQVIQPAGKLVSMDGRPVDLTLSPNRRFLYGKTNAGVAAIDLTSLSVLQTLRFPSSGGSMHGITMSSDGKRLYATNAASELCEADVSDSGMLAWTRQIELPSADTAGGSDPCGIALSVDGETAYVCLSRNNTLAVVDLHSGVVKRQIGVGIAPYGVALSPDGATAYVSDWGGRHPYPSELQAPSSGTPTLVDRRGIASSGCVSIVDIQSGKELCQVATGLHPSDIALTRKGDMLFVANSNSDSISAIDTRTKRVVRTLHFHPDVPVNQGFAPTGIALSADETSLFVALGGANALAEIDLGASTASTKIRRWISAGWYPGACLTNGRVVYIANVKGAGSEDPADAKGYNSRQTVGNIEIIDVTKEKAGPPAAIFTEVARTDVPPGLRHAIYIIKENRTYDQVFGDIKSGNGDPNLCVYGREVTPNQHALAEQFVLLDNYYCNGVISADGHSWATEGNDTDHLEKSFGGFARSYTFGDDPLTYSSTGFIWDNVLDHGLTFRNFGEMDYAGLPQGKDYAALLESSKEGKVVEDYTHNIGIARLRAYSDNTYPGWNLDIPDSCRADIFLRDLKSIEAKGDLPSLTIIYLPNDHTSGAASGKATPRAYVADNDLALGRVVEGITHSRFWPSTCIFVNEDDPADGFDHIDGHRSTCLVISPYTKRQSVVHAFCNQTSVLHTIERILGLPPMNRMDAHSPVLSECFSKTANDAAFTHLPSLVPLDETNPKAASLTGKARQLAQVCDRMNWSEPDANSDDVLNRVIWRCARGMSSPYPVPSSSKPRAHCRAYVRSPAK